MNTKSLAIAVATLTGLAACDMPVVQTSGYGSPAPVLVEGENGLIWGNLGSFGPVPAADAERAAEACAKVPTTNGGTAKPLGYHPDARDYTGAPIEGGGFLCG